MFEYGWVRWIVASALLGAWSATDGISKLFAGPRRPPRVRRPLWSHLLGFAAVAAFYALAAGDGRAVAGGSANLLGIAVAGAAMIGRFAGRGASAPGRHPDLLARTLFYFSLCLVVGSPRCLFAFAVPQALIAAHEAARREAMWRTQRAAPQPSH